MKAKPTPTSTFITATTSATPSSTAPIQPTPTSTIVASHGAGPVGVPGVPGVPPNAQQPPQQPPHNIVPSQILMEPLVPNNYLISI